MVWFVYVGTAGPALKKSSIQLKLSWPRKLIGGKSRKNDQVERECEAMIWDMVYSAMSPIGV